MSDDSEAPKSKAREPEAPKINAEDNPWYLLATLYGVPDEEHRQLKNKNRIAWNRYFAAGINEQTRTKLIAEKRHSDEELTLFSPEELQEVTTTFAERCKASAKNLALPAVGAKIDFSNVKFGQYAFVGGYLFSRDSSFRSATFSGGAFFNGATFLGVATFGRATFSEDVNFWHATFSRGATFDSATFSSLAHFGGAAFSDWADFDGATFSRWARFGSATFRDNSSFINAEMKGETSFEGATFKTEPPKFFGAKLHQGTVWRAITWPPNPKDKDEAGPFIDAYACLKLEMDRLKKHEDELDFFALEMQSRRVLLGTGTGLPIAIYGTFSDYGRSYLRPLVALFYLALIATLAFLPSESLSPWQSLGLSFANTLNVFGFRKDFFEPAVIARLPAWLDVVSALQTILGAILLFLFGLGIRNKFRMK